MVPVRSLRRWSAVSGAEMPPLLGCSVGGTWPADGCDVVQSRWCVQFPSVEVAKEAVAGSPPQPSVMAHKASNTSRRFLPWAVI